MKKIVFSLLTFFVLNISVFAKDYEDLVWSTIINLDSVVPRELDSRMFLPFPDKVREGLMMHTVMSPNGYTMLTPQLYLFCATYRNEGALIDTAGNVILNWNMNLDAIKVVDKNKTYEDDEVGEGPFVFNWITELNERGKPKERDAYKVIKQFVLSNENKKFLRYAFLGDNCILVEYIINGNTEYPERSLYHLAGYRIIEKYY